MVDKTETKNTTILALDVVNYSAKMNIDEKGTTKKLKKSRKIIGKLVYGDNPFDTLKGAQEMWNGYSIHLEREKIFYKEVYGW